MGDVVGTALEKDIHRQLEENLKHLSKKREKVQGLVNDKGALVKRMIRGISTLTSAQGNSGLRIECVRLMDEEVKMKTFTELVNAMTNLLGRWRLFIKEPVLKEDIMKDLTCILFCSLRLKDIPMSEDFVDYLKDRFGDPAVENMENDSFSVPDTGEVRKILHADIHKWDNKKYQSNQKLIDDYIEVYWQSKPPDDFTSPVVVKSEPVARVTYKPMLSEPMADNDDAFEQALNRRLDALSQPKKR
jgi:hypothetical protein